jgi:uncharacterized membrane protein YphA (DoxX/SURF4 family)
VAESAENGLMSQFTQSPTLDRLDQRITRWMARYGLPLMRIALGIVFLWFGVLKFFPGLSPAESVAGRTFSALTLGVIPQPTAVLILAGWECLIGLGLLTGLFLRATLALLFLQMLGTLAPLVLYPSETFVAFPYAPSLEGQYIIKNAVLIAGAVILGATVRGGRLEAEPPR